MVRFLDPEIVEKVDKSYIDIRRGYRGAAPGIRETRKCSLRTPRLPRLLMEEHLRDHWIEGWLKSRSVCGAVPHGGAGPLGYKRRVVERTRRNILSSFPQAGSWKGMQCGHGKCVTCNQGGEETLDYTRATVVYESICVRCNQSVKKQGGA